MARRRKRSLSHFLKAVLAGAGLVAVAGHAAAQDPPPPAKDIATVLDCPMRDAAFSIHSPLIDVLLSPAASAVLTEFMPASKEMPAQFSATQVPSFAAILTPETAARFSGIDAARLAELDARLRALPVTAEDKLARCARYDEDVPSFDLAQGKPTLLLFEKINGFKDVPSFDAAHAALVAMAGRKGWSLVSTDKGGAFNAKTLAQFDAVVWNNISGDVLTLSQRKALQEYMAAGGGFVGLHGTAGDPVYFWDWYADDLIGARFKGHPMEPQFQDASVRVNKNHPLARSLPAQWVMKDEWYSFANNPRDRGADILLTLDENSYSPVGMGQDLRMGDHPIAWTRCVGKGRMFYSAIGHLPDTYTEPHTSAMLEDAIAWAAGTRGACK